MAQVNPPFVEDGDSPVTKKKYVRYQHLEHYGTITVEGILKGTVHVFPKLDGSNCKVWLEDGIIHAGSRNREVDEKISNRGWFQYATTSPEIKSFLEQYPDHVLFGEWMVPHTIKYDQSIMNKWYVFDVMVKGKYLSYEEYTAKLEEHNILYIPVIKVFTDPSIDEIRTLHPKENNFGLVDQPFMMPEGLIIKNYGWKHYRFGIHWAKVIAESFTPACKGKKHQDIEQLKDYTETVLNPAFAKKERLNFYAEFPEGTQSKRNEMIKKIWIKECMGDMVLDNMNILYCINVKNIVTSLIPKISYMLREFDDVDPVSEDEDETTDKKDKKSTPTTVQAPKNNKTRMTLTPEEEYDKNGIPLSNRARKRLIKKKIREYVQKTKPGEVAEKKAKSE
nr:hypothetical protein [Abalone asfa-like virus]